jgi:predicted DNA-binding transcriptional regulator AlpA
MNVQLKIDVATIKEFKSLIKETIEKTMKDVLKSTEESNKVIDSEDKLLTRDEVMKMLKISHSTLYHYQRKDILPFIKIGSRVYFKKSDIVDNIHLAGDPYSYKSDDAD